MIPMTLVVGGKFENLEAARAGYYVALNSWFDLYAEKIHPRNNFLRVNPEKFFCSSDGIRYERTADLILSADAAALGHDKTLVRHAVQFHATWGENG